MKKIIKRLFNSFLLLLVGISVFPTLNVQAANYNDTFNDKYQWIKGDYVVKQKGSKRAYQQMVVMIRNSDGQFVYCIEPGTPVSAGTVYPGQDYDQSYVANMTEEQWRRIELLAYYGYGYGDHTDLKWYSVTQFLIWQTAPHGYDVFFTDSLNGNRITKYTDEINELNRLVNEHYKTPSFSNTTQNMNIGDTATFNDANGVLNQFEVASSDKVSATINGNSLNVTASEVGTGSITLTKRDKNYSHPAIVYVHPTSQDIMMRGAYEPLNVK